MFHGVTTDAPATYSSLLELPMPPHDECTCIRTTEAIDTPGGRQIKSHGRAGRADCFSSRRQKGERVAAAPEDPLEREEQMVAGLHSPAGQVSPISSHPQLFSTHFPLHSALILTPTISHPATQRDRIPPSHLPAIITGIEWLSPPNWGRSDHNNTLSNLIKEPFVASAL